jgi:hypothetical protein
LLLSVLLFLHLTALFPYQQMGDILIGALMVGDCSDYLCVRASRIWEFNDLQDETKLLHTDLVLLDEEVQFIFVCLLLPT